MKMMLLAPVVITGSSILAGVAFNMFAVPAAVAFATPGARVGAVE